MSSRLYNYPFLLLWFWLVAHGSTGLSSENPIIIHSTEAFFVTINNGPLSEIVNSQDPFEFIPTIEGYPDLPIWMYYRYPNGSKYAYLYGTPPLPGNFSIEVISVNKRTYDTYRDIIRLQVEPRENKAQYELQFKLTNANVENMFNPKRLTDLISIYRDILWKESIDIYFTKIVSPRDMGNRLPANPKEKEGVIIRIGSTNNFSRDLLDLEREVEPIKNRDPCPSRYKFTRFEHYFRGKQFFCDWCSFKIIKEPIKYQIDDEHDITIDQIETLSPIKPTWYENLTLFIPLSIIKFKYRNYHDDLLYCVYIPLGVCLIVLILLLPMLFTKDVIHPAELTEPELTSYRSIERATSELRQLSFNQPSKLPSTFPPTLLRTSKPSDAYVSHDYSSLPRLEQRKQSSRMSVPRSII